jgi:TolB-like protein/Tfp pilus assembly protein PilF
VRDQIRDKLPYSFEDMGELSVKNIARPVRVYALRGTEAVGDRRSSSAPFARSVSKPAEAPRLSIVVLPFANLSNDPEQQYFADGITEDLTTDLSRIAHMFVISRNTAFTYRNKPVDTKKIGHELSVRYVLEGSARRLGQVVRVNAQLIDAETDAHLWAERFDGDAGDLFAMQNTITRRIAGAVDAELITAEARRLAEHPDALDYILRGRSAYNQWPIRDNYTQAVRMFEQALALNPQSVEAQTWIAHVLATRVLRQQTNAPAADIERAAELIEQALTASPRSTHAHFVNGQVLRTQYRFEDAIPEFETVIASDPNHASAYANLGLCKFVTGSVEELIPLQERALGLDPGDPFVATVYFRIGLAHFLQSHYEDAIIAFQKACVGRSAGVADAHSFLAALYALQGKTEHAAAELAEARRLGSDNRYSSIACLKAVGFGAIPNNFRAPKIQTLLEGTYYAGLRKAGMPEE